MHIQLAGFPSFCLINLWVDTASIAGWHGMSRPRLQVLCVAMAQLSGSF
uniref:Uncharacterized protein n=1 Tax=Aegilops tauschii subsp. strangulata TaxID=200361 RepID=A0A453NM94_AEGTS